jgi:hypothetical protein
MDDRKQIIFSLDSDTARRRRRERIGSRIREIIRAVEKKRDDIRRAETARDVRQNVVVN